MPVLEKWLSKKKRKFLYIKRIPMCNRPTKTKKSYDEIQLFILLQPPNHISTRNSVTVILRTISMMKYFYHTKVKKNSFDKRLFLFPSEAAKQDHKTQKKRGFTSHRNDNSMHFHCYITPAYNRNETLTLVVSFYLV